MSKVALVAMGLVVATALPLAACGAQAQERTTGASGVLEAATFTWEEGVPGRPVEADALARGVAHATGGGAPRVQADTLREVAAADGGGVSLRLLAARSAAENGAICLTIRLRLAMGHFNCLSEDPADALVVRDAAGGATPDAVDWIRVVGVARSDVARVDAVLASGETRALALNQWRGFAYAASRPADALVDVRAYDARANVLDSHEIAPYTPPCPSGEPSDC